MKKNAIFYLFMLAVIGLICLFWYQDSHNVGYSVAENTTWKFVLGAAVALLLVGAIGDRLTRKKTA